MLSIKTRSGKISRLDEYYADCEESPKWRKEMNIGKPIEQEDKNA